MSDLDRAAELLVDLFGLRGKVALVTGARQGIGRAIAVALAQVGACVAVTSRAPKDLAATVREIERVGAEALALGLDVAAPDQVEASVRAVVSRFGRLDILINNAGLTVRAKVLDLAIEDWSAVIATNLTGAFLMSRAAARVMQGDGRIISLSSTFARTPFPGRAAYAVSKAGLEQLTRVLALELAPRITVNAIAPTTIVTETRAGLFRDAATRDKRIAQIPLGRLSTTDDLIGTVLLLSGKAGTFITGRTIVVDGGFSLR